ncbi:MAG: hypothetical protein GY853_03280 [PVC group bacterium]|nr:hypothetical protein [PVC group bacterium]
MFRLIALNILLIVFVFNVCSYAQLPEDADDYDQLIAQVQEALKINPYDPNLKEQLAVLYHNQGVKLSENGQWADAILILEQAYDLRPQEAVIKTTLASLYNAYGLELRDQRRLTEALSKLKSALEYAPEELQIKKNLAVVYLDLAHKAFEDHEYDNCSRFLHQAVFLDANNPYVHMLFGELAYKKDDYFQAETAWNKALDLEPTLYELRVRLEKLKAEKQQEQNFSYREIDNFKLKFEGLDKQELADSAAQILRDAYREVGQDFNLYPNSVIPVIIYPMTTLKKLDYFPDWAAGVYDGKIRIGDGFSKNKAYMKAVLYHEYTHVLVRILGHDNVPLWLNEGIAEYEAKRVKKVWQRKARKQMLLKAVRKNVLFSFDDLANMTLVRMNQLSAARIELIYAQSESFVTYLIERYSVYDIRNVLVGLGKGANIYKSIKKSLYVDLDVLIKDWQNEFK